MEKSKIQNLKSKIYLGIDGGQSHTEAIIADENGVVLGRGFGGASNHADIPGGRERLENAIVNSVGEALKNAGLSPIAETIFASAHCGMTGGAIYKDEIIRLILEAETLVVGHDAPTALFGATAGKPGIVVIAGTGSVVFGINENGESARIGGLGYLFSDEGSGFWLAAQMIRLAIKEQDGLIEKSGILEMVTDFFKRAAIRELTDDFYNGKVSRDEIASLAKRAHEVAVEGNQAIRGQILHGVEVLTESVARVAEKLNFQSKFPVAGIGGMFRAQLTNEYFENSLAEKNALAAFVKPRFGPACGALLLAYEQAKIGITKDLLNNLEKISN
ncbi:MAG: ATPase [Acidobacteriota bacterium]|nr:ATPase [Acidobacteriota bacterium]